MAARALLNCTWGSMLSKTEGNHRGVKWRDRQSGKKGQSEKKDKGGWHIEVCIRGTTYRRGSYDTAEQVWMALPRLFSPTLCHGLLCTRLFDLGSLSGHVFVSFQAARDVDRLCVIKKGEKAANSLNFPISDYEEELEQFKKGSQVPDASGTSVLAKPPSWPATDADIAIQLRWSKRQVLR